MKIKIELSYFGQNYCGWQRQASQKTVQGEVECALQKIYDQQISITGSGRTDTGVHAIRQTADFDADGKILPNQLVHALNFHLPNDIRVRSACEAETNFNSRKSAHKKTYHYDLYLSDTDNPLLNNRALRLNNNLDIDAMQNAAKIFVGEHDFASFACVGSSAKTTIRTIFESSFTTFDACADKGLRYSVSANGFLYKMVRLITGALIKVGEKKLTLNDLQNMLDNGNANSAQKFAAPAYGLYLYNVEY